MKGRKRHLLVDTLGLLLAASVGPASVQDRDAADDLVEKAVGKSPSLKMLFLDSAYEGPCAARLKETFGINVEISRRSDDRLHGQWRHDSQPAPVAKRGFEVLPIRWVVERSHGWNNLCRRLAKDYEQRLDVSTAWLWLAQVGILVRRLTSSRTIWGR